VRRRRTGGGTTVFLAVIAYDPIWQRVEDFQTIIAGVMAIAAAVFTAWGIWRAAELPVKAEGDRLEELRRRQLAFVRATLDSEWQALLTRTRHADATIEVTVAANATVTDATRAQCSLPRHKIIDDWSFMSLFPVPLISSILQLYALVDDHNYDMQRAGGAFGVKDFQDSLHKRLETIRTLCLTLRNQIAR
jgi:hypothetical protein